MKKIAKFVSVKIKDFKNIKDFTLHLQKLNEIYGKNQTGKSAVLEAIHFACRGGKNDIEKIRVGAEKAEVVLGAEENDVPIEIKTTINKKGTVTCTGKVNGIAHDQPRTLIKRLLSFGTFNPREMLDKKDRLARLLKLVPIFIKDERELSVPEMRVAKFPIADPNSIDLKKHAFYVLEALEKDLRNSRLSKGREKDIFLKAYQKRKEDQDSACIVFQKNHGEDPLKMEKSHEDQIREHESLSTEKKMAIEEVSRLFDAIRVQNNAVEEAKKDKQRWEASVVELRGKIALLNKSIEQKNEVIENATRESLKLIARKKEKQSVVDKANDKLGSYEGKVKKAREAERLKVVQKELEDQKKEADEKEKEWKAFDMLVKKAFPALQNKILQPITKLIPGFVIKDGQFTYNGIPIDSLSGSEVISLSMKLMALEENSNLLLINEAEAMDPDSIKDANFDDFSSVIIARVGDKPLKGWNSVKMEDK